MHRLSKKRVSLDGRFISVIADQNIKTVLDKYQRNCLDTTSLSLSLSLSLVWTNAYRHESLESDFTLAATNSNSDSNRQPWFLLTFDLVAHNNFPFWPFSWHKLFRRLWKKLIFAQNIDLKKELMFDNLKIEKLEEVASEEFKFENVLLKRIKK